MLHRRRWWTPIIVTAGLSVGLAVEGRELTFEQRVAAQEAIDRVYHSHQVGATRAFNVAVPRRTLEGKVRDYLRRSAALEAVWKRPVTSSALHAELRRIASRTRDPGRLEELYDALGNDIFLLQECLARATLVRRLTRNFFAADQRIHGISRAHADKLRRDLLQGVLGVGTEPPYRTEIEVVRGAGTGSDLLKPSADGRPLPIVVDVQTYERIRARLPRQIGEVGELEEERSAYSFSVLLGETPNGVSIATYRIPKERWNNWWSEVGQTFDVDAVSAVAAETVHLPIGRGSRGTAAGSSQRGGLPAGECVAGPDDIWDSGVLDDFAERRDHTVVWTGNEMIVWGGRGPAPMGLPVFNTGARYDPVLDVWTPVSTVNAPAPRHSHSAVWTGNEMIVWGGTVTDVLLRTGARYDPASDTWNSIASAPQFNGRWLHTAIWTGTEMIVWGGRHADGSPGLRYDLATDTWTPLPTLNAPDSRWDHTAVWTGNEMIVWGGEDDSGELDSGGFYRPLLDRWSALPTIDAPSPRRLHTAVWTGNEMIVWGGKTGVSTVLDTGARVNPYDSHWTHTSMLNVPEPRAAHVAVWTGNEMLIWGRWVSVDTGGRYDPVADTWTPMSTTNQPEYGTRGVWTGDEMIVWEPRSGGRYDPATDSWVPVATSGPIEARINHTAVWTGNEMIVWGGAFGTSNHPGFGDGARYDTALDSWSLTSTAGAPDPRELHTTVWTGDEMIVWGGRSSGVGSLGTGGRYYPLSDAWSPVTLVDAPDPRTGHTTVWTGDEMIVWGGWSAFVPVSSGARYDPQTDGWAPVTSSQAPAAREDHTAVWSGQEMLVWGGTDAYGWFDSGGRYDPQSDTWMPTSSTNAPPASRHHTAVWADDAMLIWGGSVAPDAVAAYDPVVDGWSLIDTTDPPPERSYHSVVWTGSEMIVWGGHGYGGPSNDGGRYDPAQQTWRPTSLVDAPSARYYHTAVWTGDRMIVWGGTASAASFYSGGAYFASLDTDADGIRDSCDCAPGDPQAFDVPPEITNLRWLSDRTTLEWDSAASEAGSGTSYDVVRGDTAEFPPGSGVSEICLESETTSTSTSDSGALPTGVGRYYLVRGANSCGKGTYGTDSFDNSRVVSICP